MAAEAFLDTNVLLYLLSADDRKADRAEDVIAAGGVVSVQVLNEFASVATRKLGMTLAEAAQVLATVRRCVRVVPGDEETHDLGMDVAARHSISIYDAMVAAAAIRAGCATLVTEDLQDGGRIDKVRIRNPFRNRG